MVYSAGCKINIGLSIVEKRNDGFHNLETIMYPISFMRDIIEVVHSPYFKFTSSGKVIDCNEDKNLVVKSYRLLESKIGGLPPLHIHLHKENPFGAGLGSGSSDATATLKGINHFLGLEIPIPTLIEYAAELGSDTPFFVRNTPQFCSGRGEIMEEVELDLSQYHILVAKPKFGISTKEAFSGITPTKAKYNLKELASTPIEEWKNLVINDFEQGLFKLYPQLEQIKKMMYSLGASYSSMSGSGSAVFAIFKEPITNLTPLTQLGLELFYGRG